MLAKKYRFHSRGGVRYTYKHGTVVRQPKISLTFNHNSRGKQRFAVVVSKKVLKSAVARNRIRRRVYEAIREQLPSLKSPNDHIFTIYSKDIKDISFSELQAIISDLLNQSN
ncbi:ribonuclease P protein component [Candidatus Saccharibacteria bacterium]|nr:ribonuclease P protein component [Candidatus Saccharibacteria bacterium]